MTPTKRPKDMTDAELAGLGVKSQLENERGPDGGLLPIRLSPEIIEDDDLMGYWRDRAGTWWREPGMF